MTILGLAGSLRKSSYNRQLLSAASSELSPGTELVVYDQLGDIPPYNEDLDGPDVHPAVQDLRSAIERADAVLLATPEYNHSVPGVLKNALDWASRPHGRCAFQGKPAAVIGTSTGLFGAVWAQAEARKVLGAMGARVLDRELPVGQAHQAFTADGRLVEPTSQAALAEILTELQERAVPVHA